MARVTDTPDRRLPRSMHLTHSQTIARSRADVFRFLTVRVPARYRELARGHERYDVVGGGPIGPDSRIDCRERAGNQEIHHAYVVREFVRDRRLAYASTPSRTFIHLDGRTVEGLSDTHVYYDLHDDPGGTRVDMEIVIQLPTLVQSWLAKLTGSQRLWGAHQREELATLARLVEDEPEACAPAVAVAE